MEVVGQDKKKVLWEVVKDHVLEEPTDHEEIGLQGFYFNVFDQYEEVVVREGSSGFPYLLMLFKLCTNNWKTNLKRMNQKLDEDNRKALNKGYVRYQKVCRFSSNEFWMNIGCLVSASTFGLGGSGLWDN